MVAGDDHHGHDGHVRYALGLEHRNDRIEVGPAFDGIDEDLPQAGRVKAALQDGIIGVGRMGRAVGHDQDGIGLA